MEAAKGHGREAVEYLSSVVEFTGYDELKRPGSGHLARLDTPERVDYAMKALRASLKELDSFLDSFPPEMMQEARSLYAQYFPESPL
jgi:hypothetical protein